MSNIENQEIMSNPDQEKALSTIAALSHSMAGTKLTDIQIDLLMVAANLMTNIAVQSQIAASTQIVPDPEFEIGEPVNVKLADHRNQRATVVGKTQHLRGFHYQTSATGTQWITVDLMEKVQR